MNLLKSRLTEFIRESFCGDEPYPTRSSLIVSQLPASVANAAGKSIASCPVGIGAAMGLGMESPASGQQQVRSHSQ